MYPIRVLHVLNAMNRGGAETMVMNLYKAVDTSIVQFDFIVHSAEKGEFDDEIRQMGGKIYVCPKFKGHNILKYLSWWKKFFKEHKNYKILHSHIRSCASLYLPIAKKYGLRTIIHSHSTSNGKGFKSLVKKILQYPLRYQADFLFACSKEAGGWLFGRTYFHSEKSVMFPNAVDIDKLTFNEDIRNEYRKLFNIEDKIVFGHVGRFHESKNHMFLIDVFMEIHRRNSNTVLMIVGDGELRLSIETRIQQHGIDDSVILTGSRNDVSNLLQAMDVFLLPSLWEGLPVTLVEAQAAGLPCLVSDTITKDADISDLIHRLPLGDVSKWADLALSPLVRHDVSKEIKASGFDIKDSAKSLTTFYQKIYEGNENGEVYHKVR